MSENYLNKLKLFCEIRNEIIHPVHYGVNSQDNIPQYLKKLGIEKFITDKSTRPLLGKITDWKFVKWCFEVIESLALQIIQRYYGNDELLLQFEDGYKQFGKHEELFVAIVFRSSCYRRADIDNLTKLVYDALEKSCIIENDKQIRREYHDIVDTSENDVLFVLIQPKGDLNFNEIAELMFLVKGFVPSSGLKSW